ncbi:lipopolysaccharide heptosyltransferase family protein [Hyunsoonleella flava]|uniref:Lipopolysaccharide heptosyltransferase family protein n=1 Tax=Hyunsoonleella flava TaxID=2527939 RepID=A0A4Q9FHP7_9FLAO|nr:glycosyltransferase family 9 protein [Hyunsoonleella flava]TBN06608.1 lipopolysaccharide heptosyltransferase family protein [Hyunsoonleella flava]
MSFKSWINQKRRLVMNALTKRVGSSYLEPTAELGKTIDIKKVLIIRPNHRLGNQLLTTPLVQEVENTFPDCRIDLFAKGGVAFPVFEKYDSIDKIYKLPRKPFSNLFSYAMCWISIKRKRYDMVINGDKDSSSGRLLTNLAKAPLKVFGDVHKEIQNTYDDYLHISKYPVYNLRRYLSKLGYPRNNSSLPVLNLKLSKEEIQGGKHILNDLNKNGKPTICIYTNATGNKCYSEEWWELFYSKLKENFAETYNIIEMLPIENISKINFKAPNFYSKDIREMGGIIANTSIFIAADNGVMHLASAALTPTVGLFSRDNQAIYGPYGNGSVALHTGVKSQEDCIEEISKILSR